MKVKENEENGWVLPLYFKFTNCIILDVRNFGMWKNRNLVHELMRHKLIIQPKAKENKSSGSQEFGVSVVHIWSWIIMGGKHFNFQHHLLAALGLVDGGVGQLHHTRAQSRFTYIFSIIMLELKSEFGSPGNLLETPFHKLQGRKKIWDQFGYGMHGRHSQNPCPPVAKLWLLHSIIGGYCGSWNDDLYYE